MTKVLHQTLDIHRQKISNSGMKISRLSFLLFCLPSSLAIASTDDDVVRSVAETRQSISTNINGIPVDVVDVGRVGSCEAVSIVWPRSRIENYRVCDGVVTNRHTVSPLWDGDANSARIFQSVVSNAIMYGHSEQSDKDGYLIRGTALGAAGAGCKNIEVVISYDGDMVERGIRKICQ